ncbi:MAG TPA: HipA family kinase [Candidatus Nanopelagicaceae bacterium]|nr:HipA family kinase [Candidatus Nanopelagicaceae bacterium]
MASSLTQFLVGKETLLAQLQQWLGSINDRHDNFDALRVVSVLEEGGGSFGSPVKVLGSDRRIYFVKTMETLAAQYRQSIAIEQIVARVGQLIGASVCEASLIRIPDDFIGYQIKPAVKFEFRHAHASLAVENAVEVRTNLEHRHLDDNKSRHVGVYALYDWCFGHDPQWLHEKDNAYAMVSHDHGLYFPNCLGAIDQSALRLQVNTPNPFTDSAKGLNRVEVEVIADKLDSLRRGDILDILNQIPASWPVTNEDLEVLGWFLEERAKPVADRLRALQTF